MEPRGCKRWQSLANATAQGTVQKAKSVAVGCDQLLVKEGVDGSSPSEGFSFLPA
jgi:hypothetical protein